jgi:hypothetical protein
MSTVKGNSTITFVKQGDTINTSLRSTKPLEQYLKKGTSTVSPDWTQSGNQPTIYPVVRSSLTDTRIEPESGSEVWKYNGSVIPFSGNLSTVMGSIPAGTFKKESKKVDGDTTVPTLTICKNLASADNINADVIEFGATVDTGFRSAISASIDIRIEEIEGDPYVGYITVNDGGVIDSNTSSLALTAALTRGGQDITSGVTYKWYKASGNNWTNINKATKSIPVTAADIDTQELYKCEFFISGSSVGSAVIPVYDESDPLVVVPNPDGDEEISSARRQVVYSPLVCKRGDINMTPVTGFTFSYQLTNSSYAQIASGSGSSFTVTYAHGVAAGGNMTLIITAQKD